MIEIRTPELVYPELSYKLVGIAFTVSNELGFGHLEKVYQKAYAKELSLEKLKFTEQIPYPVLYKGEVIDKRRADFLVEDKIIIELKRNDVFSKKHIEQVVNYLKVSDLKLALLIHFAKEGVKYKRILNIK